MRAACGLRNDLVDDAEVVQVLRPDLHVFGGLGYGALVFPEDGGAAFRRNYGIERIFEHHDGIAHSYAQGSTASALSDDDVNYGDSQS